MGSGGTHRVRSTVISANSVGMLPASSLFFKFLYPQSRSAPSQTAALSEVAASAWLVHLQKGHASQQPQLGGDRPCERVAIQLPVFTRSPPHYHPKLTHRRTRKNRGELVSALGGPHLQTRQIRKQPHLGGDGPCHPAVSYIAACPEPLVSAASTPPHSCVRFQAAQVRVIEGGELRTVSSSRTGSPCRPCTRCGLR